MVKFWVKNANNQIKKYKVNNTINPKEAALNVLEIIVSDEITLHNVESAGSIYLYDD